jgi:SAM-dependent methyltransferase
MVGNLLRRLKHGTEHLNYGRDVIAAMAEEHCAGLGSAELRVLDIGLGNAEDLLSVGKKIRAPTVSLYGLESYAPNVERAREKGIDVRALDIERQAFPFPEAHFHLVLANQVVEHTKEIFWIFSEVSRVLVPGGAAIVGVPNLASLHSRVMLLLGMQPSPVEVLGPHVRGFTKGGFTRFITAGGFFEVKKVRGSNFYPFPAWAARPLARLFPTLSVSLFFLCVRTGKAGTFIQVLNDLFFETEFFKG